MCEYAKMLNFSMFVILFQNEVDTQTRYSTQYTDCTSPVYHTGPYPGTVPNVIFLYYENSRLRYHTVRMYDTVQYSYVHGLGSTTQTHTISVTLIAALHRGVELYVRALTIVTTMSLVPRVLQYTVYTVQYTVLWKHR